MQKEQAKLSPDNPTVALPLQAADTVISHPCVAEEHEADAGVYENSFY